MLTACGQVRAQSYVPPPVPPPIPFPKVAQPMGSSGRVLPGKTTPNASIRPVSFMNIQDDSPDGEMQPYPIRLEPPGPELLFRLESEEQLQERIRQEAKQRNDPEKVEFPEKPVLTKVEFKARNYSRQVCEVEPLYVMHRRLYFEEKNAERYGWDFGFVQPLVSLGSFYKDVIFFPYHVGTNPLVRYDASAGYCLPGDPVPYLLYPPGLSITGGLLQAGTVVGLAAIFP